MNDLTAGLRAGDLQSLREAYEHHKQDVLAVAAAVLGRTSASEAWDVLHDVFVGLARNAQTLRPDTNLRAYLTRAAANRARDRHRTSRSPEAAVAESASAEPDILDQLERDEEAAALWRVIATLPEDQRVVVALRVGATSASARSPSSKRSARTRRNPVTATRWRNCENITKGPSDEHATRTSG